MATEGVASSALTFLFTDLADSTLMWERRETEMAEAVARHDLLLAEVVVRNAGKVVKFQGDGLMAVFEDADSAVRAAVEGQRVLRQERFRVPLGVRMGLCTGATHFRDGDYHGQVVNRAARAAAAAHPGQILLAPSTAALLGAFRCRDLGEHRLKGLAPMRLSQVLADGIESHFPLLAVPSIGLGVAPATAFVGRTQELARIQRLVADHAVVTLTGAGGSGKTRLAIEAAETLSEQFPDGLRFADLAVVTADDGVADAVPRALGLVDNGELENQVTRIAAHLENRAILCILDNCEHLLDACAELVDAVMERRGTSRVLATSREPLGVPGEQVYLVPSLDARTDATTLFAARACEVRPELVLDDATAEIVALICARLDGIPLAIELAAARVNQLTPAQLLERLGDRFRLLTGGRRRVQRHQTLSATLDWSHDLLDDHGRTLLRRLAVFPSSFSIEASEAVTGVSGVIALGSLVSKSLVNVVDGGDQYRYRLLETVRLYAEEKLAAAGESHDVRQRHAAWVRSSLEAIPLESRWFGDDPRPVDIADITAALEWAAVAGPASLTACLASGVSWTRFDHWRDGIRWCETALDTEGLDPGERLQVEMMLAQVLTFGLITRPRAEIRAGTLWADHDKAVADVVATGVDDPLIAFTWAWRGSTAATIAETKQDAGLARLCAEWMELGTSSAVEYSLPWRACMAMLAGFGYTTLRRSVDAQRHLASAAAHTAELDGFEGIHSAARAFLSLHRVVADDVESARSLTEGLVELPEPAFFSREALAVASVALAAAGDGAAARRHLLDAFERAQRVDQRFGVEHVIVFAGAVAAVEGDWETAVRVFAASRDGYRRTPFAYLAFLTYRERARAALGVSRFRELHEEGRRLTFDDAIAMLQ